MDWIKIIWKCIPFLSHIRNKSIEKIIEKTWNEIQECFEKYSIIVPKNKYKNVRNDTDPNLIWEYFYSQGIIQYSIDEFSKKFIKNQSKNNEWDEDEWRKEIRQLKKKEIKNIFDFWNKILKKIKMIEENINNMGILMLNIETNLSEISFYKKISIKIDNFYANLQPGFDIWGFWSHYDHCVTYNEIPYSDKLKEENKKIKKQNFYNLLISQSWELEFKFEKRGNFMNNEEVFSIEYLNDKVVGIKSFLNRNTYFSHSICDCYGMDKISQENMAYLDGCLIYFIYLSELLGLNIIDFIGFLKNEKCHWSNYLKTKLEDFYNTGVYRFKNTIKQNNRTISMECFASAKFPEKKDNISEKC